MALRLGIEVGNGHTDLLLLDDSGAVHGLRAANRPGDPAAALAAGIRRLSEAAGAAPGDIGTVVHGAPGLDPAAGGASAVGLLVTAGFEHVLLLARGQGAGPMADRVTATLGIAERIDAAGQVQKPIDEAAARSAIRVLRDAGANCIAVALLHAAANPAHERALKALIADEAGGLPAILSSDVVAEAADYERTVAAVAAAVLRPALTGYLGTFADRLRALDIAGELRVARADGGAMTPAHAGEAPVEALQAARAAGMAAAAAAAGRAGCRDALVLDMGAGGAGIGVVADGAPVIARRMPVASARLSLPAVAIAPAGIGGSAAVRLTGHGALRVGPEAAPGGPACFGGDGPTLTDANLVLGLIPAAAGPDRTDDGAAGRAPDRAAAEAAIARLADRLGVSPHHAAQGIRDLANEKLYGALRQCAAAHGIDLAALPLVACGGDGPLHGNALAMLCGDGPVVIPARPDMMAARGYVEARPRQEFARSCRRLLDDTNAAAVGGMLDELSARAGAWLDEEGAPATGRRLRFEADVACRDRGADFTLEIDPARLPDWGLRDLADRFRSAFEQRHGVRPGAPAELVRLRAIAGGRGADRAGGSAPRPPAGRGDAAGARIGEQRIFLDSSFLNATVYAAGRLEPGSRAAGPALVAGSGWTALIHPGYAGTAAADGGLTIAPDRAGEAGP